MQSVQPPDVFYQLLISKSPRGLGRAGCSPLPRIPFHPSDGRLINWKLQQSKPLDILANKPWICLWNGSQLLSGCCKAPSRYQWILHAAQQLSSHDCLLQHISAWNWNTDDGSCCILIIFIETLLSFSQVFCKNHSSHMVIIKYWKGLGYLL